MVMFEEEEEEEGGVEVVEDEEGCVKIDSAIDTMRDSAPPIPKSRWMKHTRRGEGVGGGMAGWGERVRRRNLQKKGDFERQKSTEIDNVGY
jgi:hypothetical protein